MKIHKHDYRVYYEDTDAGGIMYHGRYINWCERARAEYLRNIGLQSSTIFEDTGVLFVVRHLEADYLKPAKLDQLLRAETSLKEMKNSSFILNQSIFLPRFYAFLHDSYNRLYRRKCPPCADPRYGSHKKYRE